MPVDGEKGVMVFMNVLNIEHVSKIFGDKKIFDDGVIDLLNNNHYNNDIINFILKYKSEYIKNILVNIDFKFTK